MKTFFTLAADKSLYYILYFHALTIILLKCFKVLVYGLIAALLLLFTIIYTGHRAYIKEYELQDVFPAVTFSYISGLQLLNDEPVEGNMSFTLHMFKETLDKNNLKTKATAEKYCSEKRFLVFECDLSTGCGGWGDRQRGIVTAFLLALLTNRVFVIKMDVPCSLDKILDPNAYDWNVCNSFLSNRRNRHYKQILCIDNQLQVYNALYNADIDSEWHEQVIGIHININLIELVRKHRYTKLRMKWLQNTSNEDTFRLVLNTLFKPTENMMRDLYRISQDKILGKRLVCGHIRMGKNPSVPKDFTLKFGSPNDSAILSFLKLYDNRKNVIYIATDSDGIKRKAVESLNNVLLTQFNIVHVDIRSDNDPSLACGGFYMAVLEQYLLSSCDTLLLTRSSFGCNAAYLRGRSDNLFLYITQNNTVIRSNLSDVQNAFQYNYVYNIETGQLMFATNQ